MIWFWAEGDIIFAEGAMHKRTPLGTPVTGEQTQCFQKSDNQSRANANGRSYLSLYKVKIMFNLAIKEILNYFIYLKQYPNVHNFQTRNRTSVPQLILLQVKTDSYSMMGFA